MKNITLWAAVVSLVAVGPVLAETPPQAPTKPPPQAPQRLAKQTTPQTSERRSVDPLPTKLKKQGDECPGNCDCGCLTGGECRCEAKAKERKIEVMCGSASYAPTYTSYSTPVAVTYSAPVYSYSAPSYSYSAPVYSYSTPTYSRPVYYSAPTYSYSAPVYRGYSGGYSGGYSSRSFGFSVGRSFSGGGYSSGGGC